MELEGIALLLAAVTGIVEFLKRAVNFEWRVCVIIAGAAVTGWLLAPMIGIEPLIGMVTGFGASGFVTFAQNFGAKAPAPAPELG